MLKIFFETDTGISFIAYIREFRIARYYQASFAINFWFPDTNSICQGLALIIHTMVELDKAYTKI